MAQPSSLKTRAGRSYKFSSDPLANWGVLLSRISQLTEKQLVTLLERESSNLKRTVVLRALSGRLNMVRARKRGLLRLSRAEEKATRQLYGVKPR